DVAVTGKATDAIGELVAVDQLHRGGEIGHAYARQHRTEDFFFVDAHLGGDVVEQRATEPETLVAAFARLGTLKLATIGQQCSAFVDADIDIAGDALAGLGGHD